MDFGKSIETCMTKYATFEGRASRSEYWWFILFTFLVGAAFRVILHHGIVSGLVHLIFVLPTLAASARRLHDTNRSGWWQLLCFTGIGAIVVLIMLCIETQQQTNDYGPPPGDADNAT